MADPHPLMLEPTYQPTEQEATVEANGNDAIGIEDEIGITWPTPISNEAFHGIAGEIVQTIAPHTEADPAALMVQFLVTFGSVIGRGPHFTAEADQHYTNQFCVLVGETSAGRKGSSLGHITRLLHRLQARTTAMVIPYGPAIGGGNFAGRNTQKRRYRHRHAGRLVWPENKDLTPC